MLLLDCQEYLQHRLYTKLLMLITRRSNAALILSTASTTYIIYEAAHVDHQVLITAIRLSTVSSVSTT